jgi:hypothetical protein
MIRLTVRISTIAAEDRKRLRVPVSETFAFIAESPDRPGQAARLAWASDVPAGVHPEQYCQNLATVVGGQWTGDDPAWEFVHDGDMWVGRDLLACDVHQRRACRTCGEDEYGRLIPNPGMDTDLDFTSVCFPNRSRKAAA